MATWAALIAAIAGLITAIVYGLLYLVAKRQVDATLSAANEQTSIMRGTAQLQIYHQITVGLSVDAEMRSARAKVRACAENKAWLPEDIATARRVAAAFNIAAVLAEQDALPKALFVDQYRDVLLELEDQLSSIPDGWGASAYRNLWKLLEELGASPRRAA